MNVLAIVPARGGSKGLPRKNILPLAGRPLLYWSVLAALESRHINRVLVSTDDESIAKIARDSGAEVPFLRPPELAADDILDYPVIRHAIDYLLDKEGYTPRLVVQLRPTSPLRPQGLIDDAIEKLQECKAADSLRVVCEPVNDPYKMWKIVDDFMVPLIDSGIHEQYNQPRQNLPKTYWQIGTLDVIRLETIIEKNSLSGDRILPYLVNSDIAIDIDDAVSFEMAERACRARGFGE